MAVGDLLFTQVDYDRDDDGLIDISNAGQLNAVRYDTDGNGQVDADDVAAYTAAFSNAPPGMGCFDKDTDTSNDGACTGYELVADVDLSAYSNWVPIPSFSAVLDGDGHTISNLTITDPDLQEVGLFGSFSGVVQNLGIIAPTVSANDYTGSGGARVGALAGQIDGTVERVFVRGGSVSSSDAGLSADPTLIGGLLGRVLVGGSVTDSYSTAAVSGTANHQNVGGLVGRMQATAAGMSTITNTYAAGTVSATGTSGAVAGGLVAAKDTVGTNTGTINAGFYDSTVSGQSDTGKGTAKTTAEMKALGWHATDSTKGFTTATRFILIPAEYPRLPFDPLEVSSLLVSNTGQPTRATSISFTRDYSTSFTTGSNHDGYRLTAAHFRLAPGPPAQTVTPVFEVKICEQSLTTPPNFPEPVPSGTCLGTLTAPGSPDGGETVEGAVNWYTVSGDKGIALDPSTTYVVLVDTSTSGNKDLKFQVTTSDAEDSGAAAGWSVSNHRIGRALSATNWSSATHGTESLMIGVVGHERSVAQVESVAVTSWPSVQDPGDDINPDWYRRGDEIVWEVTWDEDVTWSKPAGTDNLRLRFAMGGHLRHADLVTGGATSGTARSLRFAYTVASGDIDTDGINVWPDNQRIIVTLVGNATLITTASNDFALRKHRPGNPDIFSGHKVSGNFGPDSAAPVVRSAALNAAGNALVVSFNEWLAGTVELGGSPPATSVLTVTVDGVPRTPTSVSINRHQVTLSLPSGMRVVSGQDVTLTYAQPVSNPLQDRYGNQVASFVGRAGHQQHPAGVGQHRLRHRQRRADRDQPRRTAQRGALGHRRRRRSLSRVLPRCGGVRRRGPGHGLPRVGLCRL